jgi:multiple sugar transport system permease protein
MYRFFCGIPEELLEAARIDGAGEWKIFLAIGVPLGSSGIFSALVLQFLECFSMIEQPLVFLQTKKLWPLSLYLPEIKEGQTGFALCCSLLAPSSLSCTKMLLIWTALIQHLARLQREWML